MKESFITSGPGCSKHYLLNKVITQGFVKSYNTHNISCSNTFC